MNQAENFILAIVIVDGDTHEGPFYIKNPFQNEPEFGIAGVNYELNTLLSKDLVYQDKWKSPEALKMRQQLNEIFENEEPALTEADLYIENRQWELDIEADQ